MNLYYANRRIVELQEKAKYSLSARWRLGELLHELTQEGYIVTNDKNTNTILVRERRVYNA